MASWSESRPWSGGWHQGRRVSAGTFIRSAEHTGQVVQLGRQVVHLLEENRRSVRRDAPRFVNLNLSAKELSDFNSPSGWYGTLARVSHRIFVEVTGEPGTARSVGPATGR